MSSRPGHILMLLLALSCGLVTAAHASQGQPAPEDQPKPSTRESASPEKPHKKPTPAPAPSSSPAPLSAGGHHRRDSDSTDPILTANRSLYVLALGDQASTGGSASVLTLAVARELNERFTNSFAPATPPWAIPEPTWSYDDLAKQCADDNALGGLIVTYYTGYASHFFLLYQEETTTFYVFAQLVSCRSGSDSSAGPEVVGIVYELPGANHTPWVVRKSQLSIPLLTLAAIGTALSPSSGNSKTSGLTLTAIAGSLFSGAGSKDVPGYSDPLRLRAVSQHVGVDLLTGLQALCASTADPAAAGSEADKDRLCGELHLAPTGH